MHNHTVTVENITLNVVEAGTGEPVLLLHGWPTCAHLWRHILPPLSKRYRAIAPDLPGFGYSDKPLDVSYSFRYYDRVLEGLVEELGVSQVHLVVHDLGGPVGLYWATQHPERIRSLTILNTTVYPMESWAVRLFFLGLRLPGVSSMLTSQWGLTKAMHMGLSFRKERLTAEELEPYLSPFRDRASRTALLKTALKLSPKAFPGIVEGLQKMDCPIRILYAEKDRILPAVAREMKRLHTLIPHSQMSSIPGTGHFLQEDNPEPLIEELLEFLDGQSRAS